MAKGFVRFISCKTLFDFTRDLNSEETMTTQLEHARQGTITKEMQIVAKNEGLTESFIVDHVAKGEIVIPCNPGRKNQIITGIGTGLRTKVNASIGTSSDICDISLEVAKAQAAQQEGADTLMELSADGDLDEIRRTVLANTDLAMGNVPLYQAFKETIKEYRNPAKLDPEYLFELIVW